MFFLNSTEAKLYRDIVKDSSDSFSTLRSNIAGFPDEISWKDTSTAGDGIIDAMNTSKLTSVKPTTSSYNGVEIKFDIDSKVSKLKVESSVHHFNQILKMD